MGHLSSTRLSLQVGTPVVMGVKEIEDVTGVSGIRSESEVGMIEILLKYEQAKTLQSELGGQLHRLLDIQKQLAALWELARKQNEYERKHLSRLIVGSSINLAAQFIAKFYTIAVGLPVILVGVTASVTGGLKYLCSDNKTEPQLISNLLLTAGQFTELACACRSKQCSLLECLRCIVKLCHKYPDELVLLRECGQVSTQDILRGIDKFMSRLHDVFNNVINSEEIHKERILDEEEAMSSNREAGVLEDVSALNEDQILMKLIRLTEAPIILTTRTTIQ